MKRIFITAAALLLAVGLSAGLLSCGDGGQDKAAGSADNVYRLQHPADMAAAQAMLMELAKEENLFKASAYAEIKKAFPDAVDESMVETLNYLWLVSLNKERYERSLASLIAPEGEENDSDYPVNVNSYLELLRNFREKIAREYERETGPEGQDESAAWLAAWRRKATERHYSLFLEDFLTISYGRWGYKEDGQEAAIIFWPLRENQALLSQALALFNEAPDKEDAVRVIRKMANSDPEQALKAIKAYKNEKRFSLALGFVSYEAISLALEPYFPDLAAKIGENGNLKPAFGAPADAGAAFKEGAWGNGLIIRRLQAATFAEALADFAQAGGRFGLGVVHPYYRPDGRADSLLKFLPLENASGQGWWLVSLRESDLDDEYGLFDRLSKASACTLFISEASSNALAGHLMSLSVVLSEREIRMRGKTLLLNDLTWRQSLDAAGETPQLTDPEGVMPRLANPLNPLFFASLAEQATAEQADMIMGPLTRVIFYTHEQGWLSLERENPALAQKWLKNPRPLPLDERFKPFKLDKPFLQLLSKRQVHEMEKTLINYLTREDRRDSPPPSPELMSKFQSNMNTLGQLLDKYAILSMTDRMDCYLYLYQYLERGLGEPQGFLHEFEEIMRQPLAPSEKFNNINRLSYGEY